jgi:O-antigen/teichoic acid export membrane protein
MMSAGRPSGARALLPPQARAMVASGSGNIGAFVLSASLPFVAVSLIGSRNYAMWALLGSVGAMSTSLDFGGGALLGAQLGVGLPGRRAFVRGMILTVAGTVTVTAAAMALWVVLTASGDAPASRHAGLLAIAWMGFATLLRSVVSLDATLAMARGQYRRQAHHLLEQSLVQTVLAIVAMVEQGSYWSLPLATTLASIFAIARARRWRAAVMNVPPVPSASLPGSTSTFAVARSAGGLILLSVSQGDRWLVGAIAGPGQLVLYDLATRLASVPKYVVASLANVVLTQRASLPNTDEAAIKALYRASQKVARRVLVVASTGILGLALLMMAVRVIPSIPLIFLLALLCAHGFASLTTVGAMFVSGQGRPQRELPWLSVAAVTFALGALGAATTRWGALALAASPLALVVGAAVFLVSRPWECAR